MDYYNYFNTAKIARASKLAIHSYFIITFYLIGVYMM